MKYRDTSWFTKTWSLQDTVTQGGQTIVLHIFVIEILDQLCSLVNWSFEIIYFATDWVIISFMSFIQSSLSLQCSHRLSYVSRGFCHAPLSLPTKQNNSHLWSSHCSISGISFLPLHWLFAKKPARVLLLFRFARNEPRDGGELGRLTLPSPNSHFPNRASLNLTLCSLSALSILPFTESLDSVSAALEHTGEPVLAPQTPCPISQVTCVSILQLCQQHPVAGAWTAGAERRCHSCLPTLGASWRHQCLPEACPMVRTCPAGLLPMPAVTHNWSRAPKTDYSLPTPSPVKTTRNKNPIGFPGLPGFQFFFPNLQILAVLKQCGLVSALGLELSESAEVWCGFLSVTNFSSHLSLQSY